MIAGSLLILLSAGFPAESLFDQLGRRVEPVCECRALSVSCCPPDSPPKACLISSAGRVEPVCECRALSVSCCPPDSPLNAC
ncbi:hypothetical protein ABL517_04705 [Bacillus velezensis]